MIDIVFSFVTELVAVFSFGRGLVALFSSSFSGSEMMAFLVLTVLAGDW